MNTANKTITTKSAADAPEQVVTKHVLAADVVKMSSINITERSLIATISKELMDRDGEVILAKAFEGSLDEFARNPILLWMHNQEQPIGSWRDVRMTADGLEGKAVFGSSPRAQEIFDLYREGHLKGFSIGFMPIESRRATEADKKRYGEQTRRVFTRVKLIEVSAVTIPANPDALARSAGRKPDADAGQGDASGGITKAMRDAIEKCVADAINKRLSAEPGSDVALLIQDTVDATVQALKGCPHCGHGSQGEDEVLDHPEGSGGDDDAALKSLDDELRQLLA